MTELQALQTRPNWVATFERTRKVSERYDCLMQDRCGDYYWYTPDYKGLFAWGATRTLYPELLADSLRLGIVRLVRGTLPANVAQMLEALSSTSK